MTEPDIAQLEEIDDEALLEAIFDLIASLTDEDVLRGDVQSELYELSSGTIFEGIEASPDGVFRVKGTDRFEANATIYVTLQYGGSNDGLTLSDSYPAYVKGRVTDGKPEIESISVDTSSFFE